MDNSEGMKPPADPQGSRARRAGRWWGAGHLSAWPHDACGWRAGQLVRLLEFAGERVAIRAGRAALDVTVFFPRAAGGQVPRAVIGHIRNIRGATSSARM